MDFSQKLDNVQRVTSDIAFVSIRRRNQMISYSSGGLGSLGIQFVYVLMSSFL